MTAPTTRDTADHAELTRLAEAAGEEALGNLLAVIHGDGGHRALEVGTKQAALEAEKIVADLLSSAPEAREDAPPFAWAYRYPDPMGGTVVRLDTNGREVNGSKPQEAIPLYIHPAAPSADKLRIAVEALGLTKSRIQTWPIDDQETCMCGSPVSGHGMGDGHSPVSQGDHAVSMLVEEIDQALAALKAEIAK